MKPVWRSKQRLILLIISDLILIEELSNDQMFASKQVKSGAPVDDHTQTHEHDSAFDCDRDAQWFSIIKATAGRGQKQHKFLPRTLMRLMFVCQIITPWEIIKHIHLSLNSDQMSYNLLIVNRTNWPYCCCLTCYKSNTPVILLQFTPHHVYKQP